MKFSEIIVWIFFIITVIFVFWYIFGSSPTFEQTILVFVVATSFSITIKTSQFGSRLDYLEKRFDRLEDNIKDSFNNMKDDINLIKIKLKINK